MTTYGTWLRGDDRGWVEDGRIFPANPILESQDRLRMKYPPFTFEPSQLSPVGQAIGSSLISRLHQNILALTVQTWHVHFVVRDSASQIGDIVKCAKEAVRYHLKAGRPIWTVHYDKRFCFDAKTLWNRIRYVEQHNLECGISARPWPFIVPFDA